MTYFNLTSTVDVKVIGNTFPQSQHVQEDMDRRDPRHILRVAGKFPADIYIPDSLLHAKAKITDYISSAVIQHPIVSDKLKAIFMEYRKEAVEYARTNIITRGKRIPYWIMNGYHRDYKYIDFSQSKVIITRIGVKVSELDIKTASGLEMAIEAMGDGLDRIVIEKMKLVDEIADDLFFIDKFSARIYYVSEKLKNVIESEGCTGIAFKKVE